MSSRRGDPRLSGIFLLARGSRSLTTLVGDLDDDRLIGEGNEKSVILDRSLESLVGFFLGEDLEKKPGRTMEMTRTPPGRVF